MAKYKIPYLISENMFPYCLLIFIFSTHAHFLHSYEANNKIINNKKDLINIINSLNHLDETSKNNNEDERKIFTNGNTEELTDTEKEKKLQQILWLMKTNYDAQKQYDLLQNPAHSGARLYFIRNPETIDEYKKYLEQKTKASRKQNVKAKQQQLRRHVMLRNNAEENDDSENDKKEQSKLFTEDKNSLAGDDGQSRHRDSVEDKIQYNNDHFEDTDEEPLTERKLPLDSLEIHNKKVHQNGRSKYLDLRREKSDLDIKNNRELEKKQKWDTKFVDGYDLNHKIDNIKPGKKLATYENNNYDDFAKINEKSKRTKQTNDIDKIMKTTKQYKRKVSKRQPFKIIHKNPKREVKHKNDFALYARTSIPYVGKKGVYDDE